VIAKSDLVILVVSSSLLALAIYRWDQNTRDVNTSTVLANTRVTAPAENTSVSSAALTVATTTPVIESAPILETEVVTTTLATPAPAVVEEAVKLPTTTTPQCATCATSMASTAAPFSLGKKFSTRIIKAK